MPCLSGRFQYPGGIIIPVVVLPVSAGAAGNIISGQVLHTFTALMDTGATQTCITTKVVQDIGLTPKGKRGMISASHTVTVNTYLFSIGFPMGVAPDPRGTASGSMFIFHAIDGMELNASGTTFDVLLGMDVISRGSFKIDFDGHFSFCF
jgi:Aspartyl protease